MALVTLPREFYTAAKRMCVMQLHCNGSCKCRALDLRSTGRGL